MLKYPRVCVYIYIYIYIYIEIIIIYGTNHMYGMSNLMCFLAINRNLLIAKTTSAPEMVRENA